MSYLFGDSQSVVSNSTIPYSLLNKIQNALAYHRVREMIAAKIIACYWIDGLDNPSDIVSKHWGHQKLLKPLLFYSGNTSDLIESDEDGLKVKCWLELFWMTKFVEMQLEALNFPDDELGDNLA
jgi:hypothetical protein